MSAQWEPPERICFERLLGEGGFGRVYLANVHWRDYTRRLAIKHMHNISSADAEFVARQRDEARMLAQLNHDHIVKVHNQLELDGHPAVLMEWIEGVDARQLLKSGPLPPRAALELVAAVADALDDAWNACIPGTDRPMRVVHRDIKPGNVLVSRSGVVKVVDFGAAQADMERSAVTRAVESDGELLFDQLGTVNFMAPERFRGERPTPAVDIFALGMVLVALLSDASLQRAPLTSQRFEDYVRDLLTLVHEACPPGEYIRPVLHLLWEMLSYDAGDRPSAAAVRDACAELADSAPGESLTRLARRVIPEMLEARSQKLASTRMPADVLLKDGVQSLKIAVESEDGALTSPWMIAAPVALGVALLGAGLFGVLAGLDREAGGAVDDARQHPLALALGPSTPPGDALAEPVGTPEAPEVELPTPAAEPPKEVAKETAKVTAKETAKEAATKPAVKPPPSTPAPSVSTPEGGGEPAAEPVEEAAASEPLPAAAPVCPAKGNPLRAGDHEVRITTADGSGREVFIGGVSVGRAPVTKALAKGSYVICADVDGVGVEGMLWLREEAGASRYVLVDGGWRGMNQ